MLISVHIPKCAGTSFRHILREVYGDALWLNYAGCFAREQATADKIPAGTTCIHGHFLADTFDDIVPERRLITWVRDPVERVVSNYHHFLRSPDLRDTCCRRLIEEKLTLRQFAELDWMRNLMTRYLAGRPLETFAFVGVAERFDESMALFATQFRCEIPGSLPRVNVNPGRSSPSYELSAADRAYLRSLNERDAALYDHAVRRLDRDLKGGRAMLGFLGMLSVAVACSTQAPEFYLI